MAEGSAGGWGGTKLKEFRRSTDCADSTSLYITRNEVCSKIEQFIQVVDFYIHWYKEQESRYLLGDAVFYNSK